MHFIHVLSFFGYICLLFITFYRLFGFKGLSLAQGFAWYPIMAQIVKTFPPFYPPLELGNPRGNENPFLLSFGILWFRWHNYWADKFAAENDEWSDEKIYLEARKWVIATYQVWTVKEKIQWCVSGPNLAFFLPFLSLKNKLYYVKWKNLPKSTQMLASLSWNSKKNWPIWSKTQFIMLAWNIDVILMSNQPTPQY